MSNSLKHTKVHVQLIKSTIFSYFLMLQQEESRLDHLKSMKIGLYYQSLYKLTHFKLFVQVSGIDILCSWKATRWAAELHYKLRSGEMRAPNAIHTESFFCRFSRLSYFADRVEMLLSAQVLSRMLRVLFRIHWIDM